MYNFVKTFLKFIHTKNLTKFKECIFTCNCYNHESKYYIIYDMHTIYHAK